MWLVGWSFCLIVFVSETVGWRAGSGASGVGAGGADRGVDAAGRRLGAGGEQDEDVLAGWLADKIPGLRRAAR